MASARSPRQVTLPGIPESTILGMSFAVNAWGKQSLNCLPRPPVLPFNPLWILLSLTQAGPSGLLVSRTMHHRCIGTSLPRCGYKQQCLLACLTSLIPYTPDLWLQRRQIAMLWVKLRTVLCSKDVMSISSN